MLVRDDRERLRLRGRSWWLRCGAVARSALAVAFETVCVGPGVVDRQSSGVLLPGAVRIPAITREESVAPLALTPRVIAAAATDRTGIPLRESLLRLHAHAVTVALATAS